MAPHDARSVKPENILYLSDGSTQIKLIDFGYAGRWEADKQLTGLCGTPDYVAPEVLSWYDDDEHGTPYGKGSDLWSLGVLLYVILSGCSPFSADEEDAILSLVAQAKYEFHEAEWQHISADAKDLISNLLVVEPMNRPTMQQLLDHAWLQTAVGTSRVAVAKAHASGLPSLPAEPSNGADASTQLAATRTAGRDASPRTPADAGAGNTAVINPTVHAVGGKKGARARFSTRVVRMCTPHPWAMFIASRSAPHSRGVC